MLFWLLLLSLANNLICRSATSDAHAVAHGLDASGKALVAFASVLSNEGRWQDAVGIARLAAARCHTATCRASAYAQGADALFMARQPRDAANLYARALEADSFWDRLADRARLLFCLAMASQESNRPRLCATYLFQAQAAASNGAVALENYVDPRCLTPEFELTLTNAAGRVGKALDVATVLEQVRAVSARFTEKLDIAWRPPPAFMPAGAREIWWTHGNNGRGGEAWNKVMFARSQPLSAGNGQIQSEAVAAFHEWGVTKLEHNLSDTLCSELEAWFSKIVGPNSTMASETGKRIAAFASDAPPLRDFILPRFDDAGGAVGEAVSTALNLSLPLLRELGVESGTVVGLGQVAAYAGGAASKISRSTGAFSETQLQQLLPLRTDAARPVGVVMLILLTDVPYLGGGTEIWPGAHRMDWASTTWDGLAFEDVDEVGWPLMVASMQIAGSRGECFILDAALPSRFGAAVNYHDAELPGSLPAARWLEISLLPAMPDHAGAMSDSNTLFASKQGSHLHPAHRLRMLEYPNLVVSEDDNDNRGPVSVPAPPLGVAANTYDERHKLAQRAGVAGATLIHNAFRARAGGHRRGVPSYVEQAIRELF